VLIVCVILLSRLNGTQCLVAAAWLVCVGSSSDADQVVLTEASSVSSDADSVQLVNEPAGSESSPRKGIARHVFVVAILCAVVAGSAVAVFLSTHKPSSIDLPDVRLPYNVLLLRRDLSPVRSHTNRLHIAALHCEVQRVQQEEHLRGGNDGRAVQGSRAKRLFPELAFACTCLHACRRRRTDTSYHGDR